MTGFEVETDIGLATRCLVPVLITAQPDRALAVAQAIADGGGKKTALTMCHGADIVSAARQEPREHRTSQNEAVLVVQEVQGLSDTEQAALLQLLGARDPVGYPRVVATSSACLFDRVRQGTFDATLFYRLNVVHIQIDEPWRQVSPAGSLSTP